MCWVSFIITVRRGSLNPVLWIGKPRRERPIDWSSVIQGGADKIVNKFPVGPALRLMPLLVYNPAGFRE